MEIIILQNKHLTFGQFLEFVEIRTKLASIFPMFIGFAWTHYYYKHFAWLPSLIFFLGALCFDMCVTSINNLMDYKKAYDQTYRDRDNVIGRHKLNETEMTRIVWILLGFSILINILLVALTDPMLLFIGMVFYGIGIAYTYGPFPISRTPLGEVASGLTMGFGIFFLAVYVTMHNNLLSSKWPAHHLIVDLNWYGILQILLMSLPLICLIANIMLANNLRDLEQDIRNHRYTLVYYLTRPGGIILYQILSCIPWLAWLTYILLGIFPWQAALAFLGIYPHFKSVGRFNRKMKVENQAATAFIEALKSFTLFSSIYLISLILMIIFA